LSDGRAHSDQQARQRGALAEAECEACAWPDSAPEGRDERMQSHIPPDHVRLRVDAFSSMVALLRSGCGIGVLPTYVGASEQELIAVSDDIEELANPAWLLTHPDLRRTARIQVFMRFIGDAVASRIRAASDAGLRAA
jgi:DNA-binding transcriptional LysR family regulator